MKILFSAKVKLRNPKLAWKTATMAKFCALLPLLHKDCKLIPNIPLILDDFIYIRSPRPEHIGAIFKKKPGMIGVVDSDTKCILFESDEEELVEQQIKAIALNGTFVLNAFARTGSVMCERAFVIRTIRSTKVSDIFNLPNISPPNRFKYEIDKSTDPAAVKALYSGAKYALQKDQSMMISISRYNGAMSKIPFEDKLIDIAICLESIFSSQTEISFKFALYNSILAEENPDKRYAIYDCLRRVYRERSNLVHGNKSVDVGWVESNWGLISSIAKLCLIRKIEFLKDKTANEWSKYLEMLALGVAA